MSQLTYKPTCIGDLENYHLRKVIESFERFWSLHIKFSSSLNFYYILIILWYRYGITWRIQKKEKNLIPVVGEGLGHGTAGPHKIF